MTTRKYSSRSQQTSLTANINSSVTAITVLSASALLGGLTISAGETYTVVIDPDTALEEIVDIYSPSVNPVTVNTLTVVRGVENAGVGQAHSAGAVVRHMATGRDFREANTHIEATTGHGATGAVVGTTNTQTLTNKTLTSPTITGTGAIAGTFTGNLTGNVTGSSGSTTGNAATATALATGRTISLTGDVTGTTGSFNGTGDVTMTATIATGVIVNADINASAAIDKTKISGTALTLADTGSVTSSMIADGTIVDADINAAAAIDKTKISGTAITAGDTGTVTSTMIANDTIVNADINTAAGIGYGKLSLNSSITSADIVDGTIVNADINASAGIALSKLALDPSLRSNHTGTQTASTISDFDTQVRTSRLDQMAAPTAAVALNAQKITGLADPTNAQDAVTLNYITTQKGVANGLAELDGSGLVPTHHLPALAITTTQVVASQAAMLALTAQIGDVAVRTDVNKSFILTATPASTLANWQELLTPTDAVLSVDGSTGAISLSGTYLNKTTGVLAGNLDAGAFTVTNLATPSANSDAATKVYVDAVAGSASAAAASAAAAATSYDSFDDRYLGSKSTAPSVDNDGNALVTGALYWNSVANAMYVWSGTAWGTITSVADIYRYRFTASGGETSKSGADDNGLTLSYIPGKEQVYLNGVLLSRTSDYTGTSGTSITSLAALAAGDVLEVITFTAFDLANVISPTVIDAKGDLIVGTAADTIGRVPVGTNNYILTADSSTATGVKWAANDAVSTAGGSTVTVASGTTVPLTIQNNGTGNSFVVNDVASDTTPFTIAADGKVTIGNTTALPGLTLTPEHLLISTDTASGAQLTIRKSFDGANNPNMFFAKSRGTNSSPTAVQLNDNISNTVSFAFDGTNYVQSAAITSSIDGTVSTGVTPGRLTFSTNNAAGASIERMRINSSGGVEIGGKDIELMTIMGAF